MCCFASFVQVMLCFRFKKKYANKPERLAACMFPVSTFKNKL